MTAWKLSTGIALAASTALVGLLSAVPGVGGATAGAAAAPSPALPPVRHVFVINLENKGYTETFGPGSAAPYLSQTLPAQGALLSQYYGIGHESNDNYIAQISGQSPNLFTQSDCQSFVNFAGAGTAPPGQAVGQGCVYPSSVSTVADQPASRGLTCSRRTSSRSGRHRT
jgi:phosphatidylinositol-3-phosphatase